ncbi:MAG TPA: hypothetical protein VFF00_07230 [Candidatus Elarobacter sp.]|nr:hypothetical protein [Candidatus Elarobacter sp.]
MIPTFYPPSGRRATVTPALLGGVRVSTPNTCACKGDQTYNKCSVSENNCDPGYYPNCDCGNYNSSCTCKPA